MSSFCIDASVWLASLNAKESSHVQAVSFFQSVVANTESLIVPEICLIECTASLARSGVDQQKSIEIEFMIRSLVNSVIPVSSILELSIKLASQLKLRSADAIYAACAKQESAKLVTLDLEIINRCNWARLP